MKKAVFGCLLVFIFVLPAFAADTDHEETESKFVTEVFVSSMTNGKAWLELDLQSRIMYLTGIENGAALLIAEMADAPNEKANAHAAVPALKRLMIKGFKFGDIADEIDRFYEQASNRRIPVVDAYRYVLKKFKGASPEELEAVQSALRKKYNR